MCGEIFGADNCFAAYLFFFEKSQKPYLGYAYRNGGVYSAAAALSAGDKRLQVGRADGANTWEYSCLNTLFMPV